MPRDPRYDILFEPVRLGPVTMRNRFYQVPHCNGLGDVLPQGHAAMRGVKAEGGWGAVCTEIMSIHPSSDTTPYPQVKLWDSSDEPGLRLLTEAIHAHGALAGAELAHGGLAVSNRATREYALAPCAIPTRRDPVQARAMDRADIREYRMWHRRAALRACAVGFDIVYVYAADDLELLQFFLSRRRNTRSDEYGGSLANRTRLLREVITDTREAVGDRCAVVTRLTIDELSGPDGIEAGSEGRDIVEMLAELPDAWDVKLSGWSEDSQTSRFAKEGYQEPYARFIKQVTSKPVIGTGRFTSPDTMVSQIRRGILDLIGAARPSIADPFLPNKIDEGRIDDIRECIGCNICVATYNIGTSIACTQNPSIGEEYKRGWHPERHKPAGSEDRVLVVGAGPAGLECAQVLGKRGYPVILAEARRELGGRVSLESRLFGLTEWVRVRDWRVGQLAKLPNVTVYRESRLEAGDITALGVAHVVLATGATWRRDGFGRHNHKPIPIDASTPVLTPDDVMRGAPVPGGPVLVFDDDDYYMGGVVAETLSRAGAAVTLVTPAPLVSAWTVNTLEQEKIQRRILQSGIEVICNHNLSRVKQGVAALACMFTDTPKQVACAAIVLVTARLPNDGLYEALTDEPGIKSVTRIGDCAAAGTIAHAVFTGRRYAETLDAEAVLRRERVIVPADGNKVSKQALLF